MFTILVIVASALKINYMHTEESPNSQQQVQILKIQILSTNYVDIGFFPGIAEWGFSAIVEVDGNRILFDTGLRSETVIKNAALLGIDLSDITEVVISHHHEDHIGGLLNLRNTLSKKNPDAISKVHVAKGIFLERYEGVNYNNNVNQMISTKAIYEASGGIFVEHEGPVELFPGVWLTGPVPRPYNEHNRSLQRLIKTAGGLVEDVIPESQSLMFNTKKGLVILSGCGHAGIINIIEYSRNIVPQANIYALVGGFHLVCADNKYLDWVANKLRMFRLKHLLGVHCTGIDEMFRIRDRSKLPASACRVGGVGVLFTLDNGIEYDERAIKALKRRQLF
jgi:7,8-dihydropterin-6-yl-methyl-4-(beta-D-ribofuranosyl)aminobenzene 5'-phosphate synthase